MNISITDVRCGLQIVLIGSVTSKLRALTVNMLSKELLLNFYYDKEPSCLEIELSEIVMKNLISIFEESSGKVKRFVIPEPQKDSFRNEGTHVYFCYEEYLADD